MINIDLRPKIFELDTVKERGAVAMQAEVDDNDDKTIHFSVGPAIHGTIFDGFTDFDLDLSCLSPPSSPTPSTSNPLPDSPSPPPSPILSRSTSFISQMSPLPQKKSKKKVSSPQLGATVGPATTSRGSWPLIKYAGRGTPIDRNRRLEWGGFAGEVAEDGILFSNTGVRSTSLDLAKRQSRRPASPKWSRVSAFSSSHSQTASSESASRGADENPPELAPSLIEGLGTDKTDEWDSIMKTVLASSSEAPASDPTKDVPRTVPQADSEPDVHFKRNSAATIESRFMSPEQIEQLNNGLEIDLGLNAPLDLGLGRRGGMNWFDLGLLPKSTNGRYETSSVYSSRAQHSPPPSVHASERRSITSTKAEDNGNNITIKRRSHPWWRRFLLRIRKVQSLISVHPSRF